MNSDSGYDSVYTGSKFKLLILKTSHICVTTVHFYINNCTLDYCTFFSNNCTICVELLSPPLPTTKNSQRTKIVSTIYLQNNGVRPRIAGLLVRFYHRAVILTVDIVRGWLSCRKSVEMIYACTSVNNLQKQFQLQVRDIFIRYTNPIFGFIQLLIILLLCGILKFCYPVQ